MNIRVRRTARNLTSATALTTVAPKESDNRFTSLAFIQAVEASFGKIDFDPCWHAASSVTPEKHLDVRRGDDGLRDAWSGRVTFVNPPWSAQQKWIERAHDQWCKGNVRTVVCFVPAKTDTKFFHDVLSKERRHLLHQGASALLQGRRDVRGDHGEHHGRHVRRDKRTEGSFRRTRSGFMVVAPARFARPLAACPAQQLWEWRPIFLRSIDPRLDRALRAVLDLVLCNGIIA